PTTHISTLSLHDALPICHIKAEDVGTQFKFNKLIRDSVLQINLDTNAWVIKASPATLGKIYTHGDRTFTDEKGNVLWVNDARIRSEEHTSELQSPCNLVC